MSDDEYENEDYEEEEFEDADTEKTPTSRSHQRSPAKKPMTPYNKSPSPTKEKYLDGDDFDGDDDLDLEKYMSKMPLSRDGQQRKVEDGGHNASKENQPLIGIDPAALDVAHLQLSKKLGYSSSPEKSKKSPNSTSGIKFDSAPRTIPSSSSAMMDDHHASLQPLSEDDNAKKVDALLQELFPERYGPKKKAVKTGGKKKAITYGMGAPRPAPTYYDDQTESGGNSLNSGRLGSNTTPAMGADLLTGLDGQLKLLKKELKTKDDKIARLTEHSMMMANQMDRLKGEVARLNARLRDAESEIETKESRLIEVVKRKKALAKKINNSSPGIDRNSAAMETEVNRLREREAALMDAVEELSNQNEDLIVKLRESMQRELDLSSKRAQLVSNSIIPRADHMLPSIYEKDGRNYNEPTRAQSEPVMMNEATAAGASGKGNGKKKKKGY